MIIFFIIVKKINLNISILYIVIIKDNINLNMLIN